MADEPTQKGPLSPERAGFHALVALLLSPILAQGAWRPLGHFFGLAGDAVSITLAALAIAAVASLCAWRGRSTTTALIVGGAAAAALAGALSLGLTGLFTILLVAAGNAALLRWWTPLLPASLDGLATLHPRLTALYVVMALVSLSATARQTVFAGDPTRVDMEVMPGIPFLDSHSCLTAYVRAEALADQGVKNLYDDTWWYGSTGLPPRPEGAEDPYQPFELDNFSYPPPFLLVLAPLAPWRGDFLAQRALWFGLNGGLIAFGLWFVTRWLNGPGAHRALLLATLFFGTVPVLLVLQIGNFHLATVILSILAMAAFDRRRDAVGGALLALTILSKISPGVLGVVLLVQRRFRSAAFAAGLGALLFAVALLRYGLEPLQAFVAYALPRLSSGAAFPPMATEAGLSTNLSLFGFAFKLQHVGFDVGDPWAVGRVIGRMYTLGVVLLSVMVVRRGGDRREQAIRWMALLTVAAMQSPFAPGYASFGLLWAITLLSVEVRRPIGAVGLFALWLAAFIAPPGLSAPGLVWSMTQTVLILVASVWLILRPSQSPLTPAVPG